MAMIDSFELPKFDAPDFDIKEGLEKLNRSFKTKLTPENGIYGVTETVKDNGVIERVGKNEFSHTFKEYLTADGHLFKRRENLGNHNNATTYFDDNGTAYLREVRKFSDNKVSTVSRRLTPDTTIVEGNFTAVTDSYGRPVYNKITDIEINKSPRPNVTRYRDASYKTADQVGHLTPHQFGGPTGPENVAAQLDQVNLSKIKRVENIARGLKENGHTVDYEMRTNYTDSKSTRPSSFEPKITVDGHEYMDLPDDLKKIYNEADPSPMQKELTNLGERYGTAHELGKKNAVVAAGLTMTVSTVENVSAYVDGEITAEEMVTEIVEDTAVSGAVAYGTTFISTAVSQTMSKSSSALIRSVGGSCVPAAVVSFAVDSYDSISAYAQGEIDGAELAYDLGESAASVAGGFAGGAIGGAAVGSIAGPVGTVVGGVVGGVVGCVVASEAYATVVELGIEGADIVAEKVETLAKDTTEFFEQEMPEKLEGIKSAFNDFFQDNNLPFNI